MEQGLADRLKEPMGADAKGSSVPSMRALHFSALRIQLILGLLHSTVDDRSLENLNISLAEDGHRLARQLAEALDRAAG